MKCTQCGDSKFSEVRLPVSEGGWVEDVEAYACLNCGHIELFLSEEKIQRIKNDIKEKIEVEKYNKKLEIKKQKLQKNKVELLRIVEDENRTVKEVKEAKQRLKKVEKELEEKPKNKSKGPFSW